MKNKLQANMRRFGTKNLHEAAVATENNKLNINGNKYELQIKYGWYHSVDITSYKRLANGGAEISGRAKGIAKTINVDKSTVDQWSSKAGASVIPGTLKFQGEDWQYKLVKV